MTAYELIEKAGGPKVMPYPNCYDEICKLAKEDHDKIEGRGQQNAMLKAQIRQMEEKLKAALDDAGYYSELLGVKRDECNVLKNRVEILNVRIAMLQSKEA